MNINSSYATFLVLDSSCDTLSVSGVGNYAFDGIYQPTNYSVSWMADEDVYKKVNGTKYLFPLNSTNSNNWGIGSITSLVTGQYSFQGIILKHFNIDSKYLFVFRKILKCY